MKYLPMLRNRLFAMASFASLVVAGGVASAPAAFADELSLGQEAAPVALTSSAAEPQGALETQETREPATKVLSQDSAAEGSSLQVGGVTPASVSSVSAAAPAVKPLRIALFTVSFTKARMDLPSLEVAQTPDSGLSCGSKEATPTYQVRVKGGGNGSFTGNVRLSVYKPEPSRHVVLSIESDGSDCKFTSTNSDSLPLYLSSMFYAQPVFTCSMDYGHKTARAVLRDESGNLLSQATKEATFFSPEYTFEADPELPGFPKTMSNVDSETMNVTGPTVALKQEDQNVTQKFVLKNARGNVVSSVEADATIPGYESMNCLADSSPAQIESVPPVRGEIPTESRVVPSVPSVVPSVPSVVPSFPSLVPSVPSVATPPLPALVPPTSSTTTFPTPLVAGMTETPQDPMNPAESGASLLTPLVAGVTESPHAPGSANQPLAAQTSTPAAPVLAGTDSPAPALARTGQAFQTVSLVAGLTAFAGAWLLVLARRRQEN